MCEFVIRGEAQREMASAIISRESSLWGGIQTQKHTHTHFFMKTPSRGGTRQRYKENK